MGAFGAWRKYRKLPEDWRRIVFYSESGQDWHHFEPLVRELTETLGRRVTFVTSDRKDAALAHHHPAYRALCIPEGWFLTLHFQFQKAGVVVLTMMDLDNLQLKRSINPVHYIYLFHSMGSTHMVDHANSYDAYDSLFCVGSHHVNELRRREALANLPERNLFSFGHPRLEALMREAEAYGQTVSKSGDERPTVLVAPTWGEDSIFNRCGQPLLSALLDDGFRVIMRPHYHTRRKTPEVIDQLLERFGQHEAFEIIEEMGESESLFRSDLLLCDWSAMAIEYALGLEKPVLFIDLPRRIRNPDWQDWGIEPLEASIREQVGRIISPEGLDTLPAAARELLATPAEFADRMRTLREEIVFNQGRCVPLGASEIARLADVHAPAR